MDRMEIIRIAGYTENEKVEIARKHLIPNAIAKHGLDSKEWSIDDDALLLMIRRYTREAGVRNLERELSTLARKAVKELMISKKKSVKVTEKLSEFLGVPKYRYGEIESEHQVGIVTGLAWTDVGGELLTIEGVMMPGKGKMTVTGNLRDVMKELISAAASYVRSRAIELRHRAAAVRPARHPRPRAGRGDPEGRTVGGRRDGHRDHLGHDRHSGPPRCRDDRRDHAARPRAADRRSEGEAAGRMRGGIKTVLIPEDNAKDLTEISDAIKGGWRSSRSRGSTKSSPGRWFGNPCRSSGKSRLQNRKPRRPASRTNTASRRTKRLREQNATAARNRRRFFFGSTVLRLTSHSLN